MVRTPAVLAMVGLLGTGVWAQRDTSNVRQQFNDQLNRATALLGQKSYAEAERVAQGARDLAVRQGLNPERSRAEALLQVITGTRLQDQIDQAIAKRNPVEARRVLAQLATLAPNFPGLPGLKGRVDTFVRIETRRAEEANAMRAFFNGNYERALSLLASTEKTLDLSARGRFYRACTLASLVSIERTPNQTQLAEARRQYQLAQSDAGQFARDTRYISPRILQLLRGS